MNKGEIKPQPIMFDNMSELFREVDIHGMVVISNGGNVYEVKHYNGQLEIGRIESEAFGGKMKLDKDNFNFLPPEEFFYFMIKSLIQTIQEQRLMGEEVDDTIKVNSKVFTNYLLDFNNK